MRPPIEFFAHGLPKGQPRPRAFARKMGGKFVARVFDAGTAEAWKSAVVAAAAPHRPEAPILGPVTVSLTFYFPRPCGHFRKNGTLKDGSPTRHVGKPDADNLAKAVLDALTQFGGFWRDDSQVAGLWIAKRYGTNPGCETSIVEAEDV